VPVARGRASEQRRIRIGVARVDTLPLSLRQVIVEEENIEDLPESSLPETMKWNARWGPVVRSRLDHPVSARSAERFGRRKPASRSSGGSLVGRVRGAERGKIERDLEPTGPGAGGLHASRTVLRCALIHAQSPTLCRVRLGGPIGRAAISSRRPSEP
jgi:hypothetical protein